MKHCTSLVCRARASTARSTIVLGRNNETTHFMRTVNSGLNPIESNVDVGRVWVTSLSDEQIDSPMRTTPLEEEQANFGNAAEIMTTTAKSEIKDLFAEEAHLIYVEHIQAEVQALIVEALFDMLQLDNNSASSGIKTAVRLPETKVMKLFSRRDADSVILECFGRWSQLDTLMNAVVEQIVSKRLLSRPMKEFINEHVSWTIDKSRLTQLYAERGEKNKKGVSSPQTRSASDAREKSETTQERRRVKNRKSRKEKRSLRRSSSLKRSKRISY